MNKLLHDKLAAEEKLLCELERLGDKAMDQACIDALREAEKAACAWLGKPFDRANVDRVIIEYLAAIYGARKKE